MLRFVGVCGVGLLVLIGCTHHTANADETICRGLKPFGIGLHPSAPDAQRAVVAIKHAGSPRDPALRSEQQQIYASGISVVVVKPADVVAACKAVGVTVNFPTPH